MRVCGQGNDLRCPELVGSSSESAACRYTTGEGAFEDMYLNSAKMFRSVAHSRDSATKTGHLNEAEGLKDSAHGPLFGSSDCTET